MKVKELIEAVGAKGPSIYDNLEILVNIEGGKALRELYFAKVDEDYRYFLLDTDL